MKKSILLMVALCSVSLMAEPVRLGGLGPDTMIETRGVTAQGVTNIVDAALEGIVTEGDRLHCATDCSRCARQSQPPLPLRRYKHRAES